MSIEVTYIDHMGSDLSVVNAARVSFGKKSDWLPRVHEGEAKKLSQKDLKLIHYLAKHKHTSPFGHCFATFHVKAPIFVARQLVKHKFLRWNEISRRYVDSEPEFYVPDEWRGRSEDKKQGSDGVVELDKIDTFTGRHIKDYWHECKVDEPYEDGRFFPEQSVAEDVCYFQKEDALDLYNKMLKLGVCPEQARMVLPQSMMTEWFWSGSLDAIADMCQLRCLKDTQYESRVVAMQVSSHMEELFPVSWEALWEYS